MGKISEYKLIAEVYESVYASGNARLPDIMNVLNKKGNIFIPFNGGMGRKNFLNELFLILKNYNGTVIVVLGGVSIPSNNAIQRSLPPQLQDKVVILSNPAMGQLKNVIEDNSVPVIYLADENATLPGSIINRMEVIRNVGDQGARDFHRDKDEKQEEYFAKNMKPNMKSSFGDIVQGL